jgi:hypothetical protein
MIQQLLQVDVDQCFPSILSSLVRTLSSAVISLYFLSPVDGRKASGVVFAALFKVFSLQQYKGLRAAVSDSLIDLIVVTVDDRMVEEDGSLQSPLKLILEVNLFLELGGHLRKREQIVVYFFSS